LYIYFVAVVVPAIIFVNACVGFSLMGLQGMAAVVLCATQVWQNWTPSITAVTKVDQAGAPKPCGFWGQHSFDYRFSGG
jgi:hypothetical protein